MRLVLASEDDLVRAAALVTWLDRPAVEQVRVDVPWLDRAEREATAAVIAARFNDCGCRWGEGVFVLALGWSLWTGAWGDGLLAALGSAVLLSLLAAVAAKLGALAWSAWRLRALLDQMLDQLTDHEGRGGRDGSGVQRDPGVGGGEGLQTR